MDRTTCRISKVGNDWAMKDCHVHIGRLEISIHPDHLGGVVFDRPFEIGSDQDYEAARNVVEACLREASFRAELRSAIERAMQHMQSISGYWSRKARGRMKEFKFLLLAIERMEAPG